MQRQLRFLFPLFIVFILFTLVVLFMAGPIKNAGFDNNVLLGANILFFILNLVSFFIQRKGLQNSNPHVFVRSVMGSMILKMFICIIAIITYVYLSGSNFNKRAVFASLFLYLLYLVTEVTIIMRMNKKNNA